MLFILCGSGDGGKSCVTELEIRVGRDTERVEDKKTAD